MVTIIDPELLMMSINSHIFLKYFQKSGHMGVLWLSYPVNKWSVRKSYWHKIGTKNLQQLKTAGYLFFSSERLRLNSDRLSCYKFAVKQLDKKFWRLHLVRNQVSPTQNAAPKRCGGAKSPHCFCIYIYSYIIIYIYLSKLLMNLIM